MMLTGRPWDEIEDTLTAPRLRALQLDWQQHPPVNDLVAKYMGFKPPAKSDTAALPYKADASDPSGFGGLVMQFPNGIIPADR